MSDLSVNEARKREPDSPSPRLQAEIIEQRSVEAMIGFLMDSRSIEISDVARARVLDAITDVIAVALAGVTEPASRIVRKHVLDGSGVGAAAIWGTSDRVAPAGAALCNGTAAHALDFDDTNHPGYTHPSCHLVPAIIALADNLSGGAVLRAYLAGFEMEVKLARALNMSHYDIGWHATATLGTFGAAAASAVVLRLPRAQLSNALGIAASMAAGIRENFGSMVKPLHAGLAAQRGVDAALLARAGLEASPAAIFGDHGALVVYSGREAPKRDELSAGWGQPLEITKEFGLAIKQFPSCGATHPAIEASIELYNTASPNDRIERVVVGTTALSPRILVYPRPRTGLQAKFSLEYCVATALLTGSVQLDDFTDAAVEDPARTALMEKVECRIDPRVAGNSEFASIVTVHYSSGLASERRVDLAKGKPARSLTELELRDKFLDCATRSLPSEVAQRLWCKLRDLDMVEDVRSVTSLLEQSTEGLT